MSPLRRVVEFGRWSNRVLWVKFPIGGMRCLSFVRSFVRHGTYRSEFSSEWDKIWTYHVFLKCLEVLFLIFGIQNFDKRR